MKKEEFSQLLVSNREEAGCSKNEMCRRIGLLFHQLQRIENASNNYVITHVFSYLAAINCIIVLYSENFTQRFSIKNKQDFVLAFKAMRKLNQLSQIKAAEKIGVIPGVITGIESRDVNTSIDKFLQCIYGLGYQVKIEKL